MRRRILLLGLATTAVVGMMIVTARGVAESETKYPPVGQFIAADGVRLHYVRRGAGRPVVLLHGNPGSLEDFERLIPALATDHLVLAFDRPGHGHSERGAGDAGTPTRQAELLHLALAALSISQPILVGHSWGGSLALAYALKYPGDLAAVVLAEGTAYADGIRTSGTYAAIATPVLGQIMAATVLQPIARSLINKGLVKAFSPGRVPPDYLVRASLMWSRPGDGRATAVDSIRRGQVMPELTRHYAELQVPIVALASGQDALTPAPGQALRLHDELPACQVIPVPSGGHMLAYTHPLVVAEAVRTAEAMSAAGGSARSR